MKILLYNPDNGITRNYMPHLWMFVLKALTPPGHEVLLIDGNTRAMDEVDIAQFVREQQIEARSERGYVSAVSAVLRGSGNAASGTGIPPRASFCP